jgi:hypothetical protein
VRLREVQGNMGELREQVAQARRADDTAQRTLIEASERPNFGRITESPEYRERERARAALRVAEEQLAAAQKEEHDLLTDPRVNAYGGGPRHRAGADPRDAEGPGQDEWERVLSSWHVGARGLEAPVDVGRVIRPPGSPFAATTITPASELPAPGYEVSGIQPLGRDERFLLAALLQLKIEPGDMAVQALTQTGKREVEGTIERDPIAKTEKAKSKDALTLETPKVKQFAIRKEGLPDKLFYVTDGLGDTAGLPAPAGGALLQWARDELTYDLRVASDLHVFSQLIAAKPPFLAKAPSFKTPKGAITAIEESLSAHKALGGKPTVLAAGPKVATELKTLLDTTERPIPIGALLAERGLTLIEVQEEHDPVLIDVGRVGCFYYSPGTLLVNPYSGAPKNEVEVRVEYDALFHCRDANGAFSISEKAMA